MPFDAAINFRATAGYVTDGAGETYCIGDAYPTTRGGVTFGWDVLPAGLRDRTTGNDRRLAGCNFTAVTGRYFRLDLPSAGTYDVHVGAGDFSFNNPTAWDFQDGTTTFVSLTATGPGAGSYRDATDVVRTAAAWPGSEIAVSRVFTNSYFRLYMRDGAFGNSSIAHVRLVLTSGGGGPWPWHMGGGLDGGFWRGGL